MIDDVERSLHGISFHIKERRRLEEVDTESCSRRRHLPLDPSNLYTKLRGKNRRDPLLRVNEVSCARLHNRGVLHSCDAQRRSDMPDLPLEAV